MPYTFNPFTGDFDRVSSGGGDGSIQFDTESGSANPSGGIIEVIGDGQITTSGAGNTITISYNGSLDPDIPTSFPTDSGTGTPANNVLNVSGGTNINTAGAGDTVTVNLDSSVTGLTNLQVDNIRIDSNSIFSTDTNGNISLFPDGTGKVNISYGTENEVLVFGSGGAISGLGPLTDGQLVIGNSAGPAAAAVLTSTGGTVDITNGSGSINLEVGSQHSSSFPTDSGTATPSGGALTLAGGTNMNTAGSGATATFNLDTDVLNLTSLTCDNLKLDGNIVSSTDTNGIINLAPDGTGGVTIDTDLTIGSAVQQNSFTVNGAAVSCVVSVEASGTSDIAGLLDHRHSNSAARGAHVSYFRSRGTHNSPTVVQTDDLIGLNAYAGYDGTDYALTAQINVEVDGSVAGNQMPGRIRFLTSPAASQTPTEALKIDSSQDVTLANGDLYISNKTEHAIPVFEASGKLGEKGPLTNGQLVIGNTGSAPSVSTLTAGSGISITNGSGTITISSSESTPWTVVTGTSASMDIDKGYISSNAGLVTLTLPASANPGDRVRVAGQASGGWKVAQNAGQVIHVGNTDTTTGTGGSIASTNQYDAVELLCVVANDEWSMISSVGNLTVV